MSITIYREEGSACAICGKPATWRVQLGGARSVCVHHACDLHRWDVVSAVAKGKEPEHDSRGESQQE